MFHVEAPWKRQTAAERSRYRRLIALPSGLSDRRQQMAADARALQAGGRPFEPGTAHRRGSASEAEPRPSHQRTTYLGMVLWKRCGSVEHHGVGRVLPRRARARVSRDRPVAGPGVFLGRPRVADDPVRAVGSRSGVGAGTILTDWVAGVFLVLLGACDVALLVVTVRREQTHPHPPLVGYITQGNSHGNEGIAGAMLRRGHAGGCRWARRSRFRAPLLTD
jgi:hypothetical protein